MHKADNFEAAVPNVAGALKVAGVDAFTVLAEVLAILGADQAWDGDTLQALMDDTLGDVVSSAELPPVNADDERSVQFWSDVAGVEYEREPMPWDPM
jgi:hypothetical protein